MVKMAKKYSLLESFNFAFHGILKAIKIERNLKIHFLAGISAAILGLILKISCWEWLILILLIAAIIALEIINSAIEAICNLLTFKLNLAYRETYWIRNFAAGAVMVLALTSLIIGGIIFLPKIF